MSKKMKTFKDFTFGVGTGESDLKVTGFRQVEEYEGLDIEGILGSGEISQMGGESTYTQDLNLQIRPGYFYIGDRECYAYNTKITQMGTPVTSSGALDNPYESGIVYIPLLEVPDGMFSYTLPNADNHLGSERDVGGAVPINVSRFAPGVLTARKALFDKLIHHDEGYNAILCYRETQPPAPSDLIPGEDPDWPMYFSPLSRYTVLPSYWREDEDPMLPHDEFYYDFEYNCIVLYDNKTDQYEYIVEFEGNNEPFSIEAIDLSVLESWPRDSILCLCADDDHTAFKEDPYEVIIHTEKTSASAERLSITAEVKSEKGNRLSNETVRFRLIRPDIEIKQVGTLNDLSPEYIAGSPQYVCGSGIVSGVIIDAIAFPSGEIYEGKVLIANENRLNGMAYVRSAGYLCPAGDAPVHPSGAIPDSASYEQSGTTDENGVVTIDYLVPFVNSSSFDVKIEAEVTTGSGIVNYLQMQLLAGEENIRYALPTNELWAEMYITGSINISGEYQVRLPIECISPSSAKVITMGQYLSALYSNTSIPYSDVTRIESGCITQSGEIYMSGGVAPWYEEHHYIDAFFQGFSPPSGEVVIMKYLDSEKITRGDSRDPYGA